MGIQDFISSTTNSLRRKSVALVKQAWAASRAFGFAAIAKIGDAPRAINIHRLDPVRYMPYDECRAKVVVFSRKFARNTVFFSLQW
ncbi:unnamed protein product [Cuscuta europaea]|uniref:Uncharacterized protein n=1 Tax=Cuscuta europaea TaxID=41803 RepID=A0A9P1EL58_CUSEU|nr:unnamed protein product [Cuscuta europaea]